MLPHVDPPSAAINIYKYTHQLSTVTLSCCPRDFSLHKVVIGCFGNICRRIQRAPHLSLSSRHHNLNINTIYL
jgi:hypothetical protein